MSMVLVWRKNALGNLICERIDKWYIERFKDVGNSILKTFELTEADELLPLSELAVKYPFEENPVLTKRDRDIVVVDIDDVLGDRLHREDKMAEGWEEYHSWLNDDTPNQDIIDLLRNLQDTRIVAVTSRPEKWRQRSMKWITDHQIPVDVLLMRGEGNFDKAVACKINLLKGHFQFEEILMVIDTDDRIIEEFSKLNITTMHIKSRKVPHHG